MFRLITAGDRKIMHRVNRWEAPHWIRGWMVFASRAGDGWLWGALGIGILFFGGDRRIPALLTGGTSLALGHLTFFALKHLIGRERPCAHEAHCWAKLLPPDRFSFPSGHTITAFSVAVPLSLYYPPLLATLVFCAMSVASSRVILGLHYLSDVLVGMLIGCSIGMASFKLVAQIGAFNL